MSSPVPMATIQNATVQDSRRPFYRLLFSAAQDNDAERIARLITSDQVNLFEDRAGERRRLYLVLKRHCMLDPVRKELATYVARPALPLAQMHRIIDVCRTYLVDKPDPKWFQRHEQSAA